MDQKVSLLITQKKLEEERQDAREVLWEEKFTLRDSFTVLTTNPNEAMESFIIVGLLAIFICPFLLAFLRLEPTAIGEWMVVGLTGYVTSVSCFASIVRQKKHAYRRWKYIRHSPYGQLIIQLSMAIKQVRRKVKTGIITGEEGNNIVVQLEEARSELWLTAHQALGLVLDRPYSMLQADALLQEVTQMVNERRKALGELGVVS